MFAEVALDRGEAGVATACEPDYFPAMQPPSAAREFTQAGIGGLLRSCPAKVAARADDLSQHFDDAA